jgi:hypothetical protein
MINFNYVLLGASCSDLQIEASRRRPMLWVARESNKRSHDSLALTDVKNLYYFKKY